jgi:hypothetical protein
MGPSRQLIGRHMAIEERIDLLVSREVEELLADNGISLAALLVRDQTGLRVEPVTASGLGGSREKDVAAVLFATAAVIASATPLIIHAINRLTARPVLVTHVVRVPLEDSAGAVVRDAEGEPVLAWERRTEWLTPPEHRTQVTIHGHGIRISLGGAEEPTDDE